MQGRRETKDQDSISAAIPKALSGSVSSFTTASTEDSSKKCLICKKGFILRRKLTCQLCLNVFCSDHCTRKRHLPSFAEPLTICDACDLEETKKEIAEEIKSDLQRISSELKESKESNERLFRELVSKSGQVNDLEMEITKQEWNNKRAEQDLQAGLEAEQGKGVKLRSGADQLRKVLDELNESEMSLRNQCIDTESQLDSLKLEEAELIAIKEELTGSIEKITQDLRESLAVDEVRKILCAKCLPLINTNFDRPGLPRSPESYLMSESESSEREEVKKKDCSIV